jgi:hypothetical protein
MPQTSTLITPIDPQYTADREAEKRRRETREWLKQRERELGFADDAPSMVPERRERR